jgi:hypothetical protein
MWYRDYTLVQNRLHEIERGVIQANLVAIAKAGARPGQRRNFIRIATAAGVRRLGRAVITLSDRIDECTAETDAYASPRERAFR